MIDIVETGKACPPMPLSFSEIEAILNLQTLIQGRANLQAMAGGRTGEPGGRNSSRWTRSGICPPGTISFGTLR